VTHDELVAFADSISEEHPLVAKAMFSALCAESLTRASGSTQAQHELHDLLHQHHLDLEELVFSKLRTAGGN